MKSTSKQYTQLQPEDRVTLANLNQQATVSGRKRGFSASVRRATWQSRPVGKLYPSTVTFDVMRHILGLRWAPEPIAMTMARAHPQGQPYRVSTETIFCGSYAEPVDELRKGLIASLRQARNQRPPAAKAMIGGHLRPPEIEDRQFQGTGRVT